MKLNEAQQGAVDAVSEKFQADVFLFNSACERDCADELRCIISRLPKRRENAFLMLCTEGGDADAAYIIARYMRANYKQFILYVGGWCKSAGTLIALGADPIIMHDFAEFGPLDVQIMKRDEAFERTSGQDVFKALNLLPDQAFGIFRNCFIRIKKEISAAITTKTASDVAAQLALGMLTPICEQIDPMKLGESYRNMNIAEEYGRRLCNAPEILARLIGGYSTHSFVIDRKEAQALFRDVKTIEAPSSEVALLADSFGTLLSLPQQSDHQRIEYFAPSSHPTSTPNTIRISKTNEKVIPRKQAKARRNGSGRPSDAPMQQREA